MSRVYVVDDHADDLELYTHILRHGGHEPVAFSSPVRALQAIFEDPPQVVLVDLLMPELDGFELVRALREEPATRDQQVVLASAVYTQREFAQVADGLARCTFLAKPATPQALLAAVEKALEADPSPTPDLPADFEERHRRAVHRKLLQEARRWERAERELTERARQDATLAELSRRALEGLSTTRLLDAMCATIEEHLALELVEVLELEEFDRSLRMTAGRGWRDGVVGATVVDARSGSLGWRTLAAEGVSTILAAAPEPLPARLAEHHVRVGLRVAIPGAGGVVGILGVYTAASRVFGEGERVFLQSAANVIGSALVSAAAGATAESREHELHAVFEGARDALAIVDAELRCVRVNDATCTLLGRTARELIGMSAAELVAPESLRELGVQWAEALRDGGGTGQVTILRPDGVRRTAEYTATMDVVPGFNLVAFRDVTERVETEEALRRTMAEVSAAERRYLDLIETLPDAIVTVDDDGTIALVNAQTEKMFGYRREDLIGQPLELLLPERLRTAHIRQRAGFIAATRSRAMGLGLDLRARRSDGNEFPVEVSLSTVKTEQGKRVTSVITDTTERRHLEQQLQQAQKLEAIGRLAAGVSHDFNNVLQVISGCASVVLARSDDDADRAELEEIVAAADRAAALTRQLLAFSRRQVLQPVVLDLNAVVGDIERMLGRMLGGDVELVTDLDPELCPIRADHAQIEQVLANLVVNARDAMPVGGRLTIATRTVPGEDALAFGLESGRHARLCVSDTGLGMDPETAARAFEPFFTTKEEGKGTGLGLATVHGIVSQSGGRVQIESAPGAGTTICIHLPAASGTVVATNRPAEAGPVAGGNERILLVEDDPVVRRLLESSLVKLGYEVASNADAEAALEAVSAAGAFDLVVTDFALPSMTGTDLAGRLRALGLAAPVLYVSGYAAGVEPTEATRSGRSALLQKPFTHEDLARGVRALLDAETAA